MFGCKKRRLLRPLWMIQSRAMRKRLFTLLLVLAVTVGGTLAYQSVQQRRIAKLLEEQTKTIVQAYASLTDETVGSLADSDLTAVQLRTAGRIRETLTDLDGDITLVERVSGISTLQAALSGFASSVTPEQSIAQSQQLLHLQEEMSERTSLRPMLQKYNDTAVRWNGSVQSDVGSIAGQIGGLEQQILPFLRFDGKSEFVPVISL
jgi:hypothetical protein